MPVSGNEFEGGGVAGRTTLKCRRSSVAIVLTLRRSAMTIEAGVGAAEAEVGVGLDQVGDPSRVSRA